MTATMIHSPAPARGRRPDGAPIWDDEAVEMLRRGCADHASYAVIAERLTRRFGCVYTRNMISGAADRRGLSSEAPLGRALVWTEAMLAALDEARARGASYDHIAKAVSAACGKSVSKKPIIDKLREQGRLYGRRASSPKPVRKVRPVAAPVAAFAVTPTAGVVEAAPIVNGSLGVDLLDLGRLDCRFPVALDAVGRHRFCGARVAFASVYCPGHARLCYVATPALRISGSASASGRVRA
jgi:hypothetical protein